LNLEFKIGEKYVCFIWQVLITDRQTDTQKEEKREKKEKNLKVGFPSIQKGIL
jgi:hypothetical protein